MARVFIDAHMFSVGWFQRILPELVASDSIRFSYGKSKKLVGEHERARKALGFYKLMGELGKRDDANEVDVNKGVAYLEDHNTWKGCGACDDPHIFAIIFLKPTPFVFSEDGRIAACRGVMVKVIDNRYCNFRLISNEDNYERHRRRIFS